MKKLLLSLIAILFAINVYAQPSTISYQGVLTNAGGAVVTETPNITFTLYDAATNGNQLWTETHNNVSVTNGLFQVELNSVNANWGTANFATDMWLQITVGATTLSPRVTFNASGYSLAGKATSLQIASGAGAGKILTSDAQGNGSWQAASGGGSTSSYGDGSAGSLIISSVTNWNTDPPNNQNLQFTDLTINANLTVPSGTIIRCTEAFTLANGVTITVLPTTSYDDPGAVDGFPYGGKTVNNNHIRFGGIGASSDLEALKALSNNKGGSSGASVGLNVAESSYGSLGGGRLTIICQGNLSVNGTINANGQSTPNPSATNLANTVGAGGGGGGVVVLASTGTVAISGVVNANGGNGANGENLSGSGEGGGGGGGGGLVFVIAPAANAVSTTNISVAGGTGGTNKSSSTTDSPGTGGGACGGNGGNGGARSDSAVPPYNLVSTAGSSGRIVKVQVPKPENVVKY